MRSINLSITHILRGHLESDFDVGQPGHAAPHDHVAGRRVAGSVQVATESRKLGQARL